MLHQHFHRMTERINRKDLQIFFVFEIDVDKCWLLQGIIIYRGRCFPIFMINFFFSSSSSIIKLIHIYVYIWNPSIEIVSQSINLKNVIDINYNLDYVNFDEHNYTI